jgi:hypothetical protein
MKENYKTFIKVTLTLALRRFTSLGVRVSALAIIGIILTLDCKVLMHSISRGLRLKKKSKVIWEILNIFQINKTEKLN